MLGCLLELFWNLSCFYRNMFGTVSELFWNVFGTCFAIVLELFLNFVTDFFENDKTHETASIAFVVSFFSKFSDYIELSKVFTGSI